MPLKQSSRPDVQILMTGLVFPESPRWHDDRLWFSDWGAHEVIAVDPAGRSEVILRVPSFPFSIDWSPDGRLLIISGNDGTPVAPGPGRRTRDPCRFDAPGKQSTRAPARSAGVVGTARRKGGSGNRGDPSRARGRRSVDAG